MGVSLHVQAREGGKKKNEREQEKERQKEILSSIFLYF